MAGAYWDVDAVCFTRQPEMYRQISSRNLKSSSTFAFRYGGSSKCRLADAIPNGRRAAVSLWGKPKLEAALRWRLGKERVVFVC